MSLAYISLSNLLLKLLKLLQIFRVFVGPGPGPVRTGDQRANAKGLLVRGPRLEETDHTTKPFLPQDGLWSEIVEYIFSSGSMFLAISWGTPVSMFFSTLGRVPAVCMATSNIDYKTALLRATTRLSD